MSWTVETVMTPGVVAVRPTTAYKEIVALLYEHGVSALPVVDVVDGGGRLVGMVSEADLLAKEEVRGAVRVPEPRSPDDEARARARTAAELMTYPVVTIRPGDSLAKAARTMHQRGIKHLPVVDEGSRLVGIVSRGDLLKPFLRSDDSIRHEVEDTVLSRIVDLAPGAIQVEVQEGVVTLKGEFEPSAAGTELLARLVGSVEGVVGVRFRLVHHGEVRPRGYPAGAWRR